MRILLAPDKFKGSLSAIDVCRAMRTGIARVDPAIEVEECPIADGGEGTVSALVMAMNGRLETRRVTGPLPEMKIDATFGVFEEIGCAGATPRRSASAAAESSLTANSPLTAVIETSAASGLALLATDQYDPLATTTFGTGELINHAIDLECRRIFIGLGGSATVDGGIGCAQACRLPVLMDDGGPTSLSEPLCGRDVTSVMLIKHGRGDKLGGVEFIGLADVTNPLFGQRGAARVFGPQKGASPETVARLDHDLQQLAARNHKLDLAVVPGAGAAGGLGFGLAAFFGARLTHGAATILDAIHFRDRLNNATFCITGEGRLDAQTLDGKGPDIVRQRCAEANVPCAAIVGIADDVGHERFSRVIAIRDLAASTDDSMDRVRELIANAAEQMVTSIVCK